MVKYISSFPFVLAASSWIIMAALGWLIFTQSVEQFAKTKSQTMLRGLCSASSAGVIVTLIDALIFIGSIIYRNWGEFESATFDLGQACVPTMSLGLGFMGCLATMFATNLLSNKSTTQASRSGGRPIGPGETFLLWVSSIANGACAAVLFCLAWVPAARLSGRLVFVTGFVVLATWALFALSIPLHWMAMSLVSSRDKLTIKLLQIRAKAKQQKR